MMQTNKVFIDPEKIPPYALIPSYAPIKVFRVMKYIDKGGILAICGLFCMFFTTKLLLRHHVTWLRLMIKVKEGFL